MLHPASLPAAVGGGLAMGALHVVTGADHISAVASLACGNSRWRAFWLGVRWGAGHSVGLVIVFVAVLALEKETDAGFMRGMNRWMGAVVGLLMIALGLYGARRARNKSDDARDAARVVTALRTYRVRAEAEVVDEQRETAGASLLPRARW